MVPVRPGKISMRRGSLSSSLFFRQQLAVLNQQSSDRESSRRGYSTNGNSVYVANSAYSGSVYNPLKSTMKRKVRDKNPETSGREKLANEKRSLTWTDRSMISHIVTYITILFSAYAIVFLLILSRSTDYYSERIHFIMKESFKFEKAYHISGILNSTITQAKSYFDL
jgi:hypothetical protein